MAEIPKLTSATGDYHGGIAAADAAEVDAWFALEILPLEPELVRFLQHHWRDRGDIEDLVQDIYVRLYEAALKETPQQARRFLFTIARNLLIDRIRHTRIVPIEAVSDPEMLDIATEAPGPDRSTMARDELRRLQTALDRLPAQCREAVVLGRIEGLSGREIAQRMGITPATVSHHLNRALSALTDMMLGIPPEG